MQLKDVSHLRASPGKQISSPQSVGEKIFQFEDLLNQKTTLKEKYILLGIPTQDCIQNRNEGIKQGTEEFRKAFYSLYDSQLREFNPVTHHPYPPSQKKSNSMSFLAERFVDLGDLVIQENKEETLEGLAKIVEFLLNEGVTTIFLIGENHEFCYGSYKGHAQWQKNKLLPLIHFNSRFHLFPAPKFSEQKTSLQKIIQYFSQSIAEGKALLQIGIQREQNSHTSYNFAEQNQIPIVEYLVLLNMWRDLQQGHTQKPLEHVRDHLDECVELGFDRHEGSIHLSMGLDVFNQTVAPGSQDSTPMGADLLDLKDSMVFFSKTRTCRVVDIADFCPQRDFHDQTARLVASLVYRFALVREEYASR